MNFEENLKNRLRVKVLKKIEENFETIWSKKDSLKVDLQDIKFYDIENAYSIYMENKMRDSSEEQLFRVLEGFAQAISVKSLVAMKKQIELEEQEKRYIKYQSQCALRRYG